MVVRALGCPGSLLLGCLLGGGCSRVFLCPAFELFPSNHPLVHIGIGKLAKHLCELVGVFLILMAGIVRGGLHPFKVGARGKARPIAAQDDHADGGLFFQRLQRIGQLIDDNGVEGINNVNALPFENTPYQKINSIVFGFNTSAFFT